MKRWFVRWGLVVLLAAAAVTGWWWLPPLLRVFLNNATAIKTFTALLDSLLALAAGLKSLSVLRRKKKESMNIEAGRDVITAGRDVQTSGVTTRAPVFGDVADQITKVYETSKPSVPALHQLPPPPGDFTGREAELAELMEAVQKGGVTISGLRGAGGIGKTALAQKLAEQLKDSYPDAQFFLDLKGTTEPLSAAQAMAHVIRGYHPDAKLPDDEAQLSGLYRSVLDGKRALLLMDNARSAEQTEPLIPPAGCVMLVTSRWKFTLPDLDVKDLDIMSKPDARGLLLKIAPRIGDHADKIAEVCGYFPLALRLAASALVKSKTVSPADYVKRLEKAGGAVELIEPSLNLSYQLLDAEMQRLWRMLAVFPGTFISLAAAAVWEISQEKAEDALNTLISYSLVECDDTTGRCHLHDLVRDFADTKLSESERGEARRRHAEHYRNVLAAVNYLYLEGGDDARRGLSILDNEWTNIRTGQIWVEVHAKEGDSVAKLCSDYPYVGAHLLELRQHPKDRISWLEPALEAARRLKDRHAEGGHLGNLGNAYRNLGAVRQAIEYYGRSLEVIRSGGDLRGEVTALNNLGLCYLRLGQPQCAIDFLHRAATISGDINHERGKRKAMGNLGLAYADLGETRRAIDFYEKALEMHKQAGDSEGEAVLLGNLGNAYLQLNEPLRAIELYQQQLAITREIVDPRNEGNALGNLGNAYLVLGDFGHAIEYLQKQFEITRSIGDRRGEGNALWNMSLALEKLGKRDEAIGKAETALETFEQIEHPDAAKVRRKLEEWRGG